MLEASLVLTLLAALVGVPLAGRVWADRRRARGLLLEAELRAEANRVLGGESLLTIRVEPGLLRRTGRVTLDAPSGWAWVIEAVWETVLARVPEGWELVIRAAGMPAPAPAARPLPRAA